MMKNLFMMVDDDFPAVIVSDNETTAVSTYLVAYACAINSSSKSVDANIDTANGLHNLSNMIQCLHPCDVSKGAKLIAKMTSESAAAKTVFGDDGDLEHIEDFISRLLSKDKNCVVLARIDTGEPDKGVYVGENMADYRRRRFSLLATENLIAKNLSRK